MVALTEIISMLVPAYLLLWVIQFVQQFLPPPGLNQMEDVLSYFPWLGLPLKLNLRREAHTTGKFLSLNIYLAGFFSRACRIAVSFHLRRNYDIQHTCAHTQPHSHKPTLTQQLKLQTCHSNKQTNNLTRGFDSLLW
jgi:hypothetical protein